MSKINGIYIIITTLKIVTFALDVILKAINITILPARKLIKYLLLNLICNYFPITYLSMKSIEA